jgi:hypothetical protein
MAKKKPSLRKPAAKSKKPKAAKAAAKVKKPSSKAGTALKKKAARKSPPAKKKPASRMSMAARKKTPAKKPKTLSEKAPARKPGLPKKAMLDRAVAPPPMPGNDSISVRYEEEFVAAGTFAPSVPATRIQIQLPVLAFLGNANVNRNSGTICTKGTAVDQLGQGPTQVWVQVFANNPEPIPPGAPPGAGATQGNVSGRNFTVDPVPGAVCAEPPNPPITQFIVVWTQMQNGSWCHTTQPFAGQCADTNDCGD